MNLAVSEPPIEGVLKPGFTAIPNVLWDSGILKKLKPSQLLVFLALCRFTTGYLRSWTCIGETLLLQLTGLSSSTLYEAKKSLCRDGYIQIQHMTCGRCEYRISEGLQALRPEAERGVVAKFARKASGGSEAYPSGQSEPWKESKEKIYHHPAQANSPTSEQAPPSGKSSPEGDDALRISNGKRCGLTQKLISAGVSEFMAHKLSKSHAPEMIAQAVERLQHVQVENPAGYLVSEILRGGYGQAVVDRAQLQREEHDKIHQLRVTQRQQEEALREQSSLRVAQQLEFFELLTPEQQQKLRLEVEIQARQDGFIRLPGWGPSHPAYRGLLSELISGLEAELKLRE